MVGDVFVQPSMLQVEYDKIVPSIGDDLGDSRVGQIDPGSEYSFVVLYSLYRFQLLGALSGSQRWHQKPH